MNIAQKMFLCFVLIGGTIAAQTPTFNGVVNPASDIPPGLPNYGIAQGSIFVIYGSNLGPGSLVQATTLPFPTTAGLGGTSITITSGATIVAAPMVYTSAGQVAAVLPSIIPVGNATLTLTFNTKSGSTPITVVQSNFGISTVNDSGSGAAVVTFANYSLVTNMNSAKPGDELVLWGTGLGPLPAGQSDANGSMGPLGFPPAIQVFVGGVSAQILYQARTPTAVGLDQINFVVPQNAPLGCNVSIIVQTTSPTATVSNAPTMSIATTDGVPCSDPVDLFPPSFLSKSSFKGGVVALQQTASISPNGITTKTASATAIFLQISQMQLAAFAPSATESSLGSCFTAIVPGPRSGVSPAGTYLNAGQSITLTSPSGSSFTLASQSVGTYQSSVSSISSGIWDFTNGTGGSDVGALSFTFPVPQPVTWTNAISLTSGPAIDRSQPLTITWTGGDANGFVDIVGSAQLGPAGSPTYSITFDCAAPTTAGQFTIPPEIMLGMPTGASAIAAIQVSTFAYPFISGTVSGLDAVQNLTKLQAVAPVIFK